ncbi:hypothetical protein C7O64_24200 [Salmonella enterica]|nr:hypothetical protein [Salmonella enterica subsp. enterica serovar Panama]EED3307868.1 hypothetical protein [Salmonella enterica subsp. enterica serovar Panama]MIX76515.1 hypothetical protein [Salmonella enterica]
MGRRKITVSDKTKELFKPFFDLSSYKEKKEGFEEEEYKRLVELCFESIGKGKLSVNRPMATGNGILTFIYRTDNDLLLDEFINRFEKKITKKRYMDFLLFILMYDTKNIEKIEKMFTRICGVDIEDNVLKAVNCLRLDGYEYKGFAEVTDYFETLKRVRLEKEEIDKIMVAGKNKKRGRL